MAIGVQRPDVSGFLTLTRMIMKCGVRHGDYLAIRTRGKFSDAAKEDMSTLICSWSISKCTERHTFNSMLGDLNERLMPGTPDILPTPLATFLRSKQWLAINVRDEIVFRRQSECWGTRDRRRGPPRFLIGFRDPLPILPKAPAWPISCSARRLGSETGRVRPRP